MSILRLEAVTAGYRKKPVLQNIFLETHPGEILILLGSNGSGKSTLLRAIKGSIPLLSGKMTIGDTDLSILSARERAALVTTMVQDIHAEPGLTGMDRIEMGFYITRGLFGKLQTEDIQKIYAMADTFGIRSLLECDLAEMSAGERQMIALMRSAVQDTPILLLDEPASALDLYRTETMFSMLHRLAYEGKTILMVLHDPTQALRHGDRILYLEKQSGGAVLHEIPSPKNLPAAETELRKLYPGLCVHKNPLFCYMESEK